MENTEINQNESAGLVLTKQSLVNLTETRKWTMFFAILGFIGIGIMIIAAFVMVIAGIVGSGYFNNRESMLFGFLAVVYIILGALYFFPILYLLKFSTNMKMAIEQTKQNNLTLAFENLKAHYRFVGILTIALFALYILIAIVIGIVGVSQFL